MEKLEKFLGKDWTKELTNFLKTPQFDVIGTKIKSIKSTGVKIAPEEKDIFRAFLECPWDKLNTIIMGSHPYVTVRGNGLATADGLAFSARNVPVAPRQLNLIYEAMDEELFDYQNYNLGVYTDLTYLSKQGILLLNASLTSTQGRFDTIHYEVWKAFISFVIKTINSKKDGIGVVLLGSVAQGYKDLFDNTSYGIFEAEHPQQAVYDSRPWESNRVFTQLNGYHKFLNNIQLDWDNSQKLKLVV